MENKNKCCLCYTSDDDKLHLGELKSCGNVHVHYYCLLLAATITQSGRDHEGILGFLLSDINSELERSRQRTCYYCKEQGASVLCFKRTCKIVFHLPCGIRNNSGHQFFGQFHSFCFNHRPKQNLPRLKDKQIFCPICFEEIAVEKQTEILWAPCCKNNSYFHKACIQLMALSAGYYFKCPLCNNGEIFQETMKKYGVFVPERDASWELEPNAYLDLRYRHCNADNCVCTRGRNYNGVGSWKMVLCYACGSQGTHRSCTKLKKKEKWFCAVCVPLMKNDQSDQNCEAALAAPSIPPPSTTPIPAPSSSPLPSTSSAWPSTFEPSTSAIFNSNSPAKRTTDRKGKNRKRSQVSTSSEDEIIDVVLTEPITTESNKTNSSYIETESDSDVVIPSPEMPKKKRDAPPRKFSGNTIVIDDEQGSPSKVTKLTMTHWSEDIEPVQLEKTQKSEQEYNDLMTELETMTKQDVGEIIYKGETCSAFQFITPPALPTPFPQPPSNGVQQSQVETYSQPSQQQPPPALTTISQNNVVLQTKGGGGGTAAASQNTNKIVMEPRVGLIVDTMTPTSQTILNTGRNAAPVMTTTQTAPVAIQPPSIRNVPPKKRWARLMASTNPPPLQALQNQFGVPQASTSTASSSNTMVMVRPAEGSAAVGDLTTGTQAKPTQPTAIVDLTSDDGQPAADSREAAFNKLHGITFPSLVIVARPHLHAKEAAAQMNDRSVLDTKVKSVLVHTPTKFTEWLIRQGLVRSEQHCTVHPNKKLNLGLYSDVSKFRYSGGYVWISECCPHRCVSVFSGSLFEGAAHLPTVLIKLIYHWACQTNIQNILQGVKVDGLYVKDLFTWLRAVCSYALQDHINLMGGLGKKIEVGVISLGTMSQDGSQRQVKIEVLGILDPELRLIRLRAVEPLADGDRNCKRRFSKFLEPLRNWVHPESTIATDLTVDKGTLHFMGFNNVIQNTQTGLAGNQSVMEYLRKIVPRMFQNTLLLLSQQIIQQFLDELVWRECYGQTPVQAFNNMTIHLAEQTRLNNVNETLIQRLNKVAANPFKNYAITYKSTNVQKMDTTSSSNQIVKRYDRKQTAQGPASTIDVSKGLHPSLQQSHLLLQQPLAIDNMSTESMVPLESYYYGTQDGDPCSPLAQKVTLNLRCCVCKVPYTNNISLLDHLLAHAHNITAKNAAAQCRYCLAILPTVEDLTKHIGDVHPTATENYGNIHPACVLCEQRFTTTYTLGKHLCKEHVPQELPYQCGTCGFRTSSHRLAIDHFYQKHDGAKTIQCPFCLKSTAVWSSKRIMSTNVTFFFTHLKKHQKETMANKCTKCALCFIQKETLKEHQQKGHYPLVDKKGVKPWPLPNNYVMVPRSKLFETNIPSPIQMAPPVSPPEEPPTRHKISFTISDEIKCKECHKIVLSTDHFPQKVSCSSCGYITDCVYAMQLHKAKCRKSLDGGPTPPRKALAADLHCICGYSIDCGNQMAKHLALCEQKTAYPNAELAQKAVDNNSHSMMLDFLGFVRKNDNDDTARQVDMN